MRYCYQFLGSEDIITPALIFYRDIIQENIRKTIAMVGSPHRLWPHVKTHKMEQMIRLQMEEGILRFKCATIAEAEMAARCGAENVLVAYPLVGPNITRFLQLTVAFPSVHFWAIGDDLTQLMILGEAFHYTGRTADVLMDVNLGMNRTGVLPENAAAFYKNCCSLKGIAMKGLHCYDGHRGESEFGERKLKASESARQIQSICKQLKEDGCVCNTVVLGGSASTPCYTDLEIPGVDITFSPGTCFVNDYGYTEKYPDMAFTPGAAVLTRVISNPLEGHFTLDLGYKGIASDPAGRRGMIVGMDHVIELFQSEEHWAFCMEPGYEDQCPQTGDELFVIPTHICPTSALYPGVSVVENGQLCAVWEVTARNRKLTY